MTSLTPRTESILGSDLSGSSGDLNRTYTLSFSNSISTMMSVLVDNASLQQGIGFSFSNGVVTFLTEVFDDQTISLNYYTSDGISIISSEMGYCSTDDVYRTTGISSSVVGTNDVSNYISEAESIICKITNQVYWKINQDALTITSSANGTLTVSGAGWTANAYADQYVYVYSGTGIGQIRTIVSNTTDTLTLDSNWTTNPVSGDKAKIFYTPSDYSPYANEALDGNDQTLFYLPKYPVQILQSLSVASVSITPSLVYLWKPEGKIMPQSGASISRFTSYPPQGVAVTYWHGVDHLPNMIKRLVELKAGLSVLQQQMGGTYDDPSTIGLPEMNISIGQAYINIEGTVRRLQEEYDKLLSQVRIYPAFG